MSAVPTAIRAIYNALVANLTGPSVYIGPGRTDDPGTSGIVLVGNTDPDETTYSDAVIGSQSWAQLGGGRRDEDFDVQCCAVAWNGDSDALAAIDAVFALMGGIETALVADASLGRALLYAPGITAMSLRLVTSNTGIAAQLPFTVKCRTRI